MFVDLIRRREWPALAGYGLLIGMLSAGYFYNVTFIQLGLTDLCWRIIGLSEQGTANTMTVLALLALVTALGFGYWMMKTGRSAHFYTKLYLVGLVVVIQTLLTILVTAVTNLASLMVWVALSALALGVGMPATFGLIVDLIPTRDRGIVAGLITGAAYFASNALSSATWQLEHFRILSLAMMIPGALVLSVILIARPPLLRVLAHQHLRPEYAVGRLSHLTSKNGRIKLRPAAWGLLGMMFAVYFIDSLGFLRLVDTPLYMTFAWQSVELNIHLFIAVTHLVAALAGGILYAHLSERQIFLWIFGFFALAQMQYVFHTRFGPPDYAPLAMPMLYAVAVSLYTVMNFALWADLATPHTICFFAALGVAFSGWAATFLSTALALYLQGLNVTFATHFELVNELTLLVFLALLLLPSLQGLAEPTSREKEIQS